MRASCFMNRACVDGQAPCDPPREIIDVTIPGGRALNSVVVAAGAVLTLAAGGVLHLAGHPSAGDGAWIVGIAVVMLAESRSTSARFCAVALAST